MPSANCAAARLGLEQKPQDAKAFHGVIALAFGPGLLMLFVPIDPIKALFWSAVLNGLITVPLMIATMIAVSNCKHSARSSRRSGSRSWAGWQPP